MDGCKVKGQLQSYRCLSHMEESHLLVRYLTMKLNRIRTKSQLSTPILIRYASYVAQYFSDMKLAVLIGFIQYSEELKHKLFSKDPQEKYFPVIQVITGEYHFSIQNQPCSAEDFVILNLSCLKMDRC